MHYVTVVSHNVKHQKAMRVSPEPFSDSPFDGQRVFGVKRKRAMVCKHRACHGQRNKTRGHGDDDIIFHT